MAGNNSYKQLTSLEYRREEIALGKQSHPNTIPVILDNAEESQYPDMIQRMYFVPYNAPVGNFVDQMRTKLNLNPAQTFFLFTTEDGKLLQTDALMSAVYAEYKDKEDGALYITYSDRLIIRPAL